MKHINWEDLKITPRVTNHVYEKFLDRLGSSQIHDQKCLISDSVQAEGQVPNTGGISAESGSSRGTYMCLTCRSQLILTDRSWTDEGVERRLQTHLHLNHPGILRHHVFDYFDKTPYQKPGSKRGHYQCIFGQGCKYGVDLSAQTMTDERITVALNDHLIVVHAPRTAVSNPHKFFILTPATKEPKIQWLCSYQNCGFSSHNPEGRPQRNHLYAVHGISGLKNRDSWQDYFKKGEG